VEALGTTEALRRKVVVRVASCWACGAPGFWFSNMKPASKSARESLRTSTGALEVGTARMLTCGEESGRRGEHLHAGPSSRIPSAYAHRARLSALEHRHLAEVISGAERVEHARDAILRRA
jgi:hypothetical protein